MANLKLVVWDLESALVDLRAAAADALHDTLRSMGHELPVRHVLESQAGLDPDAYVGQLCPELSSTQHRAVVARFCTALELSEHDQVTATSGVARVLSTLRQHRFLQATIGWSASCEANECLRALGLHHLMDRVVADGDVARPWPHPAALRELISGLRVEPSQTVVVTGTAHGVHSARKVGAFVWAAGWGPDPIDELMEQDPHGVMRRADQLLKAIAGNTASA